LAAVPARWHLTERPATDLELAELRKRSSRSIGCAIVALVLTLGVSIGITLEFAPGVSVPSVVILSLIAVLLYSGFAQFESRLRSIAARDLKRAMVEVLEVDGAIVFEVVGDHSSVIPAYVFDLEGERTLLLVGPWLEEPRVYGLVGRFE
jgi:hypothetical protein